VPGSLINIQRAGTTTDASSTPSRRTLLAGPAATPVLEQIEQPLDRERLFGANCYLVTDVEIDVFRKDKLSLDGSSTCIFCSAEA
jgi:hypothetical protein